MKRHARAIASQGPMHPRWHGPDTTGRCVGCGEGGCHAMAHGQRRLLLLRLLRAAVRLC
eukprot:COSAG01_NODE_2310_length_7942_cov_7.405330_11_plen_59_part_00